MSSLLKKDCECWGHTASLNFRDRGLAKEAIRHIYCPECSPAIRMSEVRMVATDGWLVEYDPRFLRPVSGTVCLMKAGKGIGSFDLYVERG